MKRQNNVVILANAGAEGLRSASTVWHCNHVDGASHARGSRIRGLRPLPEDDIQALLLLTGMQHLRNIS